MLSTNFKGVKIKKSNAWSIGVKLKLMDICEPGQMLAEACFEDQPVPC
jgi:hypothetical protein